MSRQYLGLGIFITVATLPVVAILYFKWNADGPGTEGGGEDHDRKVDAPMAAPGEAPEQAAAQRRRERAAISGVVQGVDGEAIAGATVCAAASSTLLSAADMRRPRCTRSGRDGRYRIDDLFGVRQRVSAGAASHLPADHVHMTAGVRRRAIDLRPGSEAKDIDIRLVRGGVEIRGVVNDLHGRPIADAWVASGGPETGTGIAWARSEADGRYTLWVRPGTVTVTAQAVGHVAGSATGPSEGHEFTTYLAPESVLRGKVMDAHSREPVEGAWVRADLGGEVVMTDAAGHFHFDGLPPGVYRPQVETDSGFGMASEQVLLGLGETSFPLMLTTQPAVFVEGRIVLEDGTACDDGSLTLRETASRREARDTTEPGGLVHVRGLLAGTYSVSVTCKGMIANDYFPVLVVRDRDLLAQEWKLTRGRSIAGVLVDADGAPVVGATVVARPVGRAAVAPAVVSDFEGRFLLRGLVAGTYEVVPVAHLRRTMPEAPVIVALVDEDVTELKIALAPTGALRGFLRDPRGATIAGAELSLRTSRGAQQTVTGMDGGFYFGSAAAGKSALSVSLGGAALPVLAHARVVVHAGATTVVELVAAAPTGAISGVLRDDTGHPMAGALVEAQAEGAGVAVDDARLWRGGGELPQLTDAAGKFRLTGLAGGAYTVVARGWGGGAARREHVEGGAALTLQVPPTGRIVGTVALHRRGNPESFFIELVETATGHRRSADFIGTDGVWGFGGLPQGSYEAHVRAREGTHVQRLELTGDELSGVRIELVGATTVRGTVVDLDGQPIPGLEVGISAVRGIDSDSQYVTDAGGQFELQRVPVGPVALTVESPRDRPGPFGVVRVPLEVQPYTRVIDLPPIRVARRRIEVGAARGDLGFTIPTGKAGDDPLLAGLKVSSVRHDGPAAAAGLLAHDEIVAVDGIDVRGADRSLYATLSEVPAGTTLRLGLARGVTVDIVAGKRR